MPQATKCKPDRNRKSGTNLQYKSENRHSKSHVRRIRKHIARYGDRNAHAPLLRYAEQAGVNVFRSCQEFLKTA